MTRRLLIVEDDQTISKEWATYFRKHEWQVDTAADGVEALHLIGPDASPYNCLILDFKMPRLNGEDFLEILNHQGVPVPPTIVVSAYLNQLSATSYFLLQAKCLLRKPVGSALLLTLASAFATGDPQVINNLLQNSKLNLRQVGGGQRGGTISNLSPQELKGASAYAGLHDRVKNREESLEAYFAQATGQRGYPDHDEPVLVIGRRWNSWYPSFFDVPGGAYCLVGPKSSSGQAHYAVIDPGFRFLKVLGDLGLSVAHMDHCIITHNHPDHLGGVFEYLAARHTLGKPTTLYCNPSSSTMFQSLAGGSLQVRALGQNDVTLMDYQSTKMGWVQIKARAMTTDHEEIGVAGSCSQAILITCSSGEDRNRLEAECRSAILGDTEYSRADHREKYMSFLVNHLQRAVILHIGCSQQKTKPGKHLYLSGLRRILTDIEAEWEASRCHGRLCALVSEWGLEHATQMQIDKICGGGIAGFGDDSPILDTMSLLRDRLERTDLIPADIGLAVGLCSGALYLEDGRQVEAQSLRWETTDVGLRYYT